MRKRLFRLATEKKSARREQLYKNATLCVATLGVVVTTIVGFVQYLESESQSEYQGRQLEAMGTQLSAVQAMAVQAENLSRAATGANQLTQDAHEAFHRAWVGFDGISVAAAKDGQLIYGPPQLDKPWYAIIEQKNTGTSPALKVATCMTAGFELAASQNEKSIHEALAKKSECIHRSKGVMMPNETTTVHLNIGNRKVWTQPLIDKFEELITSKPFIILGETTYTDQFGKARKTWMCVMYAPKPVPAFQNCSDDSSSGAY